MSPKATSSLRVQVPLFVALRVLFNTGYRMVYPFLPAFGAALGVPLTTLAGLVSARSLLSIVAPLTAQVAERGGRRLGMLAGVGLFVAGAALPLLWPSLPGLGGALLLTALGKVTFDPAMQAHLGDRVAFGRRGRALALTELGWSLGFIVGVPAVGWVLAHWGWRWAFGVLALLAGGGGLLLGVLLPHDGAKVSRKAARFHAWRAVAQSPSARAALALGVTAIAANEVVNLVFGVWLKTRYGLPLAALSASALVIGLSELSGESLVALTVDRLGKRRAVALGLGANTLAAGLLVVLARWGLSGALVGLFAFYLTFEFTWVSALPLVTEVTPRHRATLLGLYTAAYSLGRALGAGLAPVLFDWGIVGSVLGAALFNALALAALRAVRISQNTFAAPGS